MVAVIVSLAVVALAFVPMVVILIRHRRRGPREWDGHGPTVEASTEPVIPGGGQVSPTPGINALGAYLANDGF